MIELSVEYLNSQLFELTQPYIQESKKMDTKAITTLLNTISIEKNQIHNYNSYERVFLTQRKLPLPLAKLIPDNKTPKPHQNPLQNKYQS